MILAFLSCIPGRTEARLSGSKGVGFTGIGLLGGRRRFDPRAAREVRLDSHQWRDGESDRHRAQCN